MIDRDDDIVNLCEIKFHNGPFTLVKKFSEELINTYNIFAESTKTRISVFITFISSYGLNEMNTANSIFKKSLTIKDFSFINQYVKNKLFLMNPLQIDILNFLQHVKGTGEFLSIQFANFVFPGLIIDKVNEVSFPLSELPTNSLTVDCLFS